MLKTIKFSEEQMERIKRLQLAVRRSGWAVLGLQWDLDPTLANVVDAVAHIAEQVLARKEQRGVAQR